MKDRQELWCHECGKYVQFDIDLELNGNHVIVCPNCGHEHCRVIENGKITEARWDSRNVNMQAHNTYIINTGTTSSALSTYDTYAGLNMGTTTTPSNYGMITSAATNAGTVFVYGSWLNSGTGNGYI